MSPGSDGASRWQRFPAGLRVMVVDDDKLCLAVIAKMLIKCSYEGAPCPLGSSTASNNFSVQFCPVYSTHRSRRLLRPCLAPRNAEFECLFGL